MKSEGLVGERLSLDAAFKQGRLSSKDYDRKLKEVLLVIAAENGLSVEQLLASVVPGNLSQATNYRYLKAHGHHGG